MLTTKCVLSYKGYRPDEIISIFKFFKMDYNIFAYVGRDNEVNAALAKA